ncbi:hypothetical protein M431DRAFT_102560, partial [Trichoderma harzianum CBS 226.95]
TLKGYNNLVSFVVFLPDGQRLTLALYNRTVKVWDVSLGICLQTLKGRNSGVRGVTSVVFLPNGQRLALALRNSIVKV